LKSGAAATAAAAVKHGDAGISVLGLSCSMRYHRYRQWCNCSAVSELPATAVVQQQRNE